MPLARRSADSVPRCILGKVAAARVFLHATSYGSYRPRTYRLPPHVHWSSVPGTAGGVGNVGWSGTVSTVMGEGGDVQLRGEESWKGDVTRPSCPLRIAST